MAKKIQPIGLGIRTLPDPKNKNFKSLFDQTKDYEARVALLKMYLNKLWENKEIQKNAIKVVTLPQFFFRGRQGAYSIHTIIGDGVSDKNPDGLLGCLQMLVMDKKWKNWIFNFGTIIGYNEDLEEEDTQDEKTTKGKKDMKGKDYDQDNEEQASTSDSIEELLRKAEHNEKVREKKKGENGDVDDQGIDETSIKENIKKAFNKVKESLMLKRQTKTEASEDKQESNEIEIAHNKKHVLEFSKKKDNQKDNNDDEGRKTSCNHNDKTDTRHDDSEDDTDIEIKDAFQMCILINGGFVTQKKATVSTTLITTPYKAVLDIAEADTMDLNVIDLVDDKADYTLDDDSAIDHWGFILGDGSIDEKKVKALKKDTKTNHYIALQNKLRKVSGKKTPSIPATIVPIGIVEMNRIFFAFDHCFDNDYQMAKKILFGLTDRKVKLDLKDYLPKVVLSSFKKVFKSGVHIHFVSSYGTTINKKAIIAESKGWVVNAIPLVGGAGAPLEIRQVKTLSMKKDIESTWEEDENRDEVEKLVLEENTMVINGDKIAVDALFWISEDDDRGEVEKNNELDDKADDLVQKPSPGKAAFYIHKSITV